jgi:hypothetical protein
MCAAGATIVAAATVGLTASAATALAAEHTAPASAHAQQPSTHGSARSAEAKADTRADHSAGNAGTSGDATEPQPPSGADQNPGGANGDQCSTDPKGTYCSTRDGSASMNGNGDGAAVGKPCAGCVGKADNKNPPGQEVTDPMGTFPNNGYECDHNNGIGKTNPAHTGCQTAPAVCDESVEDCAPSECDEAVEDCSPTEDCIPTEDNNFCTEVEGNKHTRNNNPPDVLGERTVRTPTAPEALPFTGAGHVQQMVAVSLVAMILGFGLVALGSTRRRSTQH